MNSPRHNSSTGFLFGLPPWTVAAPVLAGAVLFGAGFGFGGYFVALIALALAGSVFAAVHHAEVIAHRVGEPYGTLVLALAVTLIEVALIVSLMIAGGAEAAALARDTVFAAVMIILNGIIGLCLLVGGFEHREQVFSLDGVGAALVALATIAVMTLIFPNFTITTPGPFYSSGQLVLIAIVSLVVYGAFIFTQTIGNRQFFLDGPADKSSAAAHPSSRAAQPSAAHAPAAGGDTLGISTAGAGAPGNSATAASSVLLMVCLTTVVLLAKKLAPDLEAAVARMGAPNAVVGVVIAGIVLLPEGLAALRAARQNRLQTSLNLALGSALASIGLTIPAVSALSLWMDTKLMLGIDAKSTVLLILSLFVASLALRTGRTIILHGVALLVIFAVYLFTTVVP
jgi:Ca2+:H+ antiporter